MLERADKAPKQFKFPNYDTILRQQGKLGAAKGE
jgi:hypothetical protein